MWKSSGQEVARNDSYQAGKVLLEISRVINSNLGLNETFRVVHAYLSELLDFDLGGYYLKDVEHYNLKHSLSLPDNYVTILGRKDPKNILLKKIEETRRPWVCTQFMSPVQLKKHPFYRDLLAEKGIFYTMGAPILVNGACLGSINVGRQKAKGDFTAGELHLLEMVANMLATSIKGFAKAYYHELFRYASPPGEPGDVPPPAGSNGKRPEWIKMLDNLITILVREIRNPLVTLKMAFYSLARNVAHETCLQPDLEQMDHSLQRMNKALDFMLSLSRDMDLNPVQVDINHLLDEVLEMTRSTLDPEVIILRDYAPLPPVVLDREKMTAVFNNVIENAVSEIPAGGALKVVTLGNGDRVRIIIEDDRQETKGSMATCTCQNPNCFNFLGMELGLAICRRIVERHGGTVELRNTAGEGLAVCIDIPQMPVKC